MIPPPHERPHPLLHIRRIEDHLRHEHPFIQDYLENWIHQHRAVLQQLRELPMSLEDTDRAMVKQARTLMDRWRIDNVGTTTGCWIERDVTASALLMDYRVKRFGRRLKQNNSWEEYWALGENLGILGDTNELTDKTQFSNAQRNAVVAACAFAVEWQEYLLWLLCRPPQDPHVAPPDPTGDPLMAFWDYHFPYPDSRAARILVELGHCRPVGAFFDLAGRNDWTADNRDIIDEFHNSGWPGQKDDWLRLGGAMECGRPTVCPHCHARMVRRLVERINKGPWKPGRRRNRQLILLRVSIPTPSLNLNEDRLALERLRLGYDRWLRLSDLDRDYTPVTREEAKVRHIDMDQFITDTLAPTEIEVARQVGRELLSWAKEIGITGGVKTHTIGPRESQFHHEICIVGEIQFHDEAEKQRFFERVGIGDGHAQKTVCGQNIECVIMPKGMRSAPRFLVAGTGWGTDLDLVGGEVNAEARRHTHISGREGEPAGLRGALAWQPLFLLSGASFWTRTALLTAPGKYRQYAAFGSWIGKIPPDKNFEPQSKKYQRNQQVSKKSVRQGSRRKNPALYVRRQFQKLKGTVTVAEIAKVADCHRSTMDLLLREGKGSPELIEKAMRAIEQIQNQTHAAIEAPQKFEEPEEVRRWLKQIGKSQRWLAEQIDWPHTKVLRRLKSQTAYSQDIQYAVHDLARRLNDNLNNS